MDSPARASLTQSELVDAEKTEGAQGPAILQRGEGIPQW
jgi:hypothetical protein